MGGENVRGLKAVEEVPGSSPRGRGKPWSWRLGSVKGRLIPAWAGKTQGRTRSSSRRAAHPRVGGENAREELVTEASDGSSPRGRGKRSCRDRLRRRGRLIPAWAGKTPPRAAGTTWSGAHPRVGGENVLPYSAMTAAAGSSPRGRGKPCLLASVLAWRRLIPAWAGKTSISTDSSASRGAHPRVGGENSYVLAYCCASGGSSPRGRGKQVVLVHGQLADRLIPAWAGKTSASSRATRFRPAHPRVGGENRQTATTPRSPAGSSPRGRGKRVTGCNKPVTRGLIPAWAGKT